MDFTSTASAAKNYIEMPQKGVKHMQAHRIKEIRTFFLLLQ
jgi:hypothetical protein